MSGESTRECGEFLPTQWTDIILPAGDARDCERQRAALARLLELYRPALRAHLVHRRRVPPVDADDLLQGFVADKVLEYGLIGRADRSRGKFRTFLCTALDRYLIDQRRRTKPTYSIENLMADGHDGLDVAVAPGGDASDDPDIVWARLVVAEAIARMKRECDRRGDPRLWQLFKCRLLDPAWLGTQPPSYEQIVQELGFASPLQASNLLVTAKRMFERCLRAVVVETVACGPDEADEEIADLLAILARAGTR